MIVIAGCGEDGVVVIPLSFNTDDPSEDCTKPAPVGLVCDRQPGHTGRCMAVTLDTPGNPARVWGKDGFDWSRHS